MLTALIAGISSSQVAISEIGVSFPDDTFGRESRFGIPFTYILRDILQFDAVRACACVQRRQWGLRQLKESD